MAAPKSTQEILRASMEAVAYQSKSGLYRELTAAFQKCIDNQITDQRSFGALGLGAIIQRYTGMAIQVILDPTPGVINAMALPVILDGNSPLLAPYKDMGLAMQVDAGKVTHEKILPITRDLRGTIDLTAGRVSGVLSKLPTEIYLSVGLWYGSPLTAEEIAAITIHEIGHVFTGFETLLYSTTTNITLASAKRDINALESQEARIELVFEVAQVLGLKPAEVSAKWTDPSLDDGAFQALFLAAVGHHESISSAGAGRYDLRSSEVMADQFAVRHGAGRALATGLFKMGGSPARSSVASTTIHTVKEARKLATVALGLASPFAVPVLIGTVLLVVGYLTFADPEFKIYDDPAERIERIRKDLIQNLKTQRMNPKIRDVLLRDIEDVEAAGKQLHDHRTLLNWLWIWVGSNRRRQYNQMRLEQELEKMVNNDIFVKAAKLQSML